MEAPESAPSSETDGWQDAGGQVNHLTLRISIKCDHCGQPIPINGPAKSVKCGACLETTPTKGIAGALNDAKKGMMTLGSAFKYKTSDHHHPECLGCGKRVQFGTKLYKHGPTATHACQECGRPSVSYPVPKWLAGQFHGALQIFGGDPPAVEEGNGTALDIPEDVPEPITMSCPSCGAALKIGVEAARATECEYCDANVFIPDALWKLLHPVKTQEFWTISYLARVKKPKKKKKNEERSSSSAKNSGKPASKQRAAKSGGNGSKSAKARAQEEERQRRRTTTIISVAVVVALFVAFFVWMRLAGG